MATSFHHAKPSLGQQTNSMSPLYQRRGAPETGHSIELLPNPDFVFPARSSEASPTLDNWNALNRRPQSAQQSMPPSAPSAGARMHRSRGSAALPDFVFNPSATATTTTTSRSLVTPPHSPTLPSPTTPSRGLGHRRGGSEFIGGDGKGGAGLMSTSPAKGDVPLPAPSVSGRLGPPAGVRGHRHRRSGAISCHDLQSIMQPKEPGSSRGGSAPATPLDSEPKPFFGHAQRRTASQADFRSSPEPTQSSSVEEPPRAVPRVRVGFSDRVEYIRPLSTISSETESSMSTIRGGHSVSNSLSSVISLSASSPPSTRIPRLPLQTTFENDASKLRPQSSGNILEAMTKDKEEFHVQWDESDRPKSAVSTPGSEYPPSISFATETKSPKRRSFGWWESKKPHHVLRSSISEPSLLPSPPTSPDSLNSPSYASVAEELSNAEPEKQQKCKKTKSWPRSLISRKSKSHGNLKTKPVQGRVPTPPPVPAAPSPVEAPVALASEPAFEAEDNFEPNFDIDETITIVTEEPRPSLSLTPFKNRLHADSDPMSPVIDLDAALGPFRTPPFGANSRGSPAKAQPRPRRSMHSLGYQTSLNHRRTESAPELVPFDLRNAKLTPTTTMPDVFEEEDEEAAEEADATSKPSSGMPTPTTNQESESALGISMNEGFSDDADTPTRKTSSLRPPVPLRSASASSLTPSLSSQPASAVEVVEDFEEPRASSLGRDSDSTITPPLTAEDEKAPRPLMNLQLPHPQQALMTPETLTASSFSSRHFSNSQVSLSTPRLGTATSSTTDNRSISFGEPGPPIRMSVDDVPSLSSSRSTMTTPPQYPFIFTGSYGPGSDGRKSSVASIPSLDEARRRSKRTSVASLSRLVGVKSKLSIETRPQSQHIMSTTMSPNKTKKTNRLSKLMHFWKKQPNGARRGSLA